MPACLNRLPLVILAIGAWMLMSASLLAQQNLFNIPSGILTPKRGLFYQNQTNAYSLTEWETKSHFVAGLGSDWEVGLNVLNKPFEVEPTGIEFEQQTKRRGSRISDPLTMLLMFTCQKKLWKKGKWHQTIGTQIGSNWNRRSDYRHFTQFHYSLLAYKPKPGTLLVGGPYLTNAPFAGDGPPAGWMMGFEYPLLGNKLVAMGDALIGAHDIGATVLGLMYEIREGVQVCVGFQFPNLPEGQEQKLGLVLELNLYNF
jgi:hypothetical protein